MLLPARPTFKRQFLARRIMVLVGRMPEALASVELSTLLTVTV